MRKRKDNSARRMSVLSGILAAVLVLYSLRLVDWQLVHQDKYEAQSIANVATYTTINAARGEIYDRYGRPLVQNKDSYNIVFNRLYLKDSELNNTIITLTKLLTSSGEQWKDKCPLTKTAPYEFEDNQSISSGTMRSELGLAHYATAQNCWDAMVEKYNLSEYDDETKRTIMGIRLTMLVADYSDAIPYTFAENISIETVTKLKESYSYLSGVETEIDSVREYVSGNIAPHILGNLGLIYAEEWDELKDKGYSFDDYIGKSGIEKACEQELKGKSGYTKTIRDSSGKIVSSSVSTEPEPGNSIVLTIDKKLQETAQNSLKNMIDSLKATKDGQYANAGAVVAVKVNTGEVLVGATYPSYDMDTYNNSYETLLSDSSNPLFNRAFSGVYAPGSTFKPATASIGLQTGAITPDENIFCSKIYTYYRDYQPSCMHYDGDINVTTAIKVSCNYFFYETGRRIGIEKMNEFCKKFGLGVKTGIEIDEAAGILAGKEYRDSIGSIWNAGDTLQAAIGQSDNGFTPLQLATYCATLANGGTRYRSRLIKEICNYSMNSVVSAVEPEVMDTVGIDEQYLDVVKQGMLSVTTESAGTASTAFANYSLKVGGKTGTATVIDKGQEYNNGVFIAFAPYENPEIAVVTVVEKGGYGSNIAQVTRDIFDAYFYYQGDTYKGDNPGLLIK